MDKNFFGGNIKRIQWNNRLKTLFLSLYFIYSMFFFTLITHASLVLIAELASPFTDLPIFYGDPSKPHIPKLINIFIKLMLGVLVLCVAFLYEELKKIGEFFGATLKPFKRNDPFFKTLEELCIARGLTVPDVYITNEDSKIPDHYITGAVVQDPKGKASLIITPAVKRLEKPLMEAFLAQVVQRIHTKDTMFLTWFCFLGYYLYHLEKENPVVKIFKPMIYLTEKVTAPVRNMILNMRFGRLDAGALELTKEKEPMQKLLSRLAPLEKIKPYMEEPYLTLFIVKTDVEYRKALLSKA